MLIGPSHKEFLSSVWEKQAAVLTDAYSAPPITTEELYEAIKTLWAKQTWDDINPYLDGRNPFPGEYLIFEPTETTFEDYCAAVSERNGGAPFGAQILHLERYSDSLRSKLHELADALASEHGIPAGYFNGGAFFGNYSETPFGIHTDPAGITTWPIAGGSKRVLIWPKSYFDDNPSRIPVDKSHQLILDRLERYERDAQVLEAKPGDLMYWPSSAWHMAQGEFGIHATVSLSFYYWNSIAHMIGHAVQAELEERLGEEAIVWGAWGRDQAFPDNFTAAVEVLNRLVSDDAIGSSLRKHWDALLANGGFVPE